MTGPLDQGHERFAVAPHTLSDLAQLAQFGGGLRDFAEGGASQIK